MGKGVPALQSGNPPSPRCGLKDPSPRRGQCRSPSDQPQCSPCLRYFQTVKISTRLGKEKRIPAPLPESKAHPKQGTREEKERRLSWPQGEGWGVLYPFQAVTFTRPARTPLTAPVGSAPSHDPGHHHSPGVLIPPDGGTLHRRQSRQAPKRQPQTSDPEALDPREPPRLSLCHCRGQTKGSPFQC